LKKRLILVGMIVLVVFIAGCVQSDNIDAGPFVGGSDGLSIRFVNGEPPSEVLDNREEDFDITLEIENEGEFDIPKGRIIATLGGIDAKTFSISPTSIKSKSELNGKDKFDDRVISGDKDELFWEDAKYTRKLAAEFRTRIVIDVCYQYETLATTKACLKKKPTDRDEEDPCNLRSENVEVFNRGAPVQIEDVTQRVSGNDQIQISFTVVKKGAGKVYLPNTFTNKCFRDEDEEDRVVVEVEVGGHSVSCSKLNGKSRGEVKLIGDIRPIRCDIKTSRAPERAIEEPVDITVKYFYRNVVSKDIKVLTSDDN